MLVGRHEEEAALDRLLANVRRGHGEALVIRGEPGIGKSALLRCVATQAHDMHVLRATAVEAESELAFASLHQLVLPVLDCVEELPEPQRRALLTAFGLATEWQPDRFMVSVSALTLLAEAADTRPLLCLVDDAHWADGPSLDVLSFVARRIAADRIGLVIAVRDDVSEAALGSLAELRVEGLDGHAAASLFDERWRSLDPVVRERVLRAAHGNPLALLELPTAQGSWEPGRLPPLGEPLPLTEELERAFLVRVHERSAAARTLLVVAAAAEGAGEVRMIRRAAALLELDPALLESGELVDLLRIDGPRVTFRHPLVRSAIYHGATPAARRDAHRALAEALSGEDGNADRLAWHQALAAEAPAEEVAGELERSAERALRRSGHAAAATAFERAAQLSPSDESRARRLIGAAESSWYAGRTAKAHLLLDEVERVAPQDAAVRLDLRFLRGSMDLRAGVPADALALLLPAAREAAGVHPGRALRMLIATREASFQAGQPQAAGEIADIVADLAVPADPDEALVASVLRCFGPGGAHGDATAIRERIAAGATELDDPELLQAMGGMAWGVGDLQLARQLRARAAMRARSLGAIGTLAWALEYVVFDELAKGAYPAAQAYAEEGRRLATETDRPNSACAHAAYLAEIIGVRGDEHTAHALAEEVLAEATSRRLVKAACDANRALGRLALAAVRPAEALDHLEALWGSGPAPGSAAFAVASTPDLVEAALRAGRPERGEELLPAYLRWVKRVHSYDLRALAARCRALLAEPEVAGEHFDEALRLHGLGEQPLEHARTELLFGEWLRRERRRVDARQHLRPALELFERLGAPLWSARARAELRASGETARRRAPETIDELTAQELQVMRLVAEGATNRDVAAQLFLSPRTVDYHLRKVFRKLGVSSRKELIHAASVGNHAAVGRAAIGAA